MSEQEKKDPAPVPAVREPVNVEIVNGSFAPRNIDQLWRLALIVAKSGLCPDEFRDNPEKTFVAMSYGLELGLSPMSCLASIYVVNNRPTIFGDMPLALCQREGIDDMAETFEGNPYEDDFKAICTVKATKNSFAVTREFSVADAKTAGLWGKKTKNGGSTPWVTHPKRMLQFKARTFALRDACPGALRGIPIYEEIENEPIGEIRTESIQTVSVPKTEVVDPIKATPAESSKEPAGFSSAAPSPPVVSAETVDPSDTERIFRDIVELNHYDKKDAEALLDNIMKQQNATREDTLRTIADDPSRFIKYANTVFAKKIFSAKSPAAEAPAPAPSPEDPEKKKDPDPELSPEGKIRRDLGLVIGKDTDFAGMSLSEVYAKYLDWGLHNARMTQKPVNEIIKDWSDRTATTIPFFKKWLFNPMKMEAPVPENNLSPSEASWRDRLAGLKVKYPEEFEFVRSANGFANSVVTEEGAKVFVLKIHEHIDNPKTKTTTKKGRKS